MKPLGQRLTRHLSLANLLAFVALFVALGGVGYAAATINGNAIEQQTIGAGKLKKGTLTSTQVKANALTGGVIDESTLNVVPSAQTAVSAQSAATAEEAETVDGFTPEDLQVSCPASTSLYGGVCWDDGVRPVKTWIGASVECGNAGGRLPSLSELVAYVLRDGVQVAAPHWSADVVEVASGEETALARDENVTTSHKSLGTDFGFRCVFYRAN